MAEYDLVIRGGTVVDGTRLPAFKADVAVAQGRIARISGTIAGRGKRELDASGCIVAPGPVDLHTHYDAQLNRDPYCTLSGWHGVTTLTIGQCGFGFAPCRPEDRDLNTRMMNRIEAIPVAAREEFLALAEVLREFGVGHIGWTIPAEGLDGVRDPLANELMAASGRPFHWGAVVNLDSYPGIWQAQLEWLEDMHRQGYPMY